MTDNTEFLFFTKSLRAPTRVEDGVFTNYSKYAKTNTSLVDELISNTQPLFEWIEPHSQIKPYYDIDFSTESEEEYKTKSQSVLKTAISVLMRNIKGLKEEEIYVDSYNGRELSPQSKKYGKYMVSYHIVLDGYHSTKADLLHMATFFKNHQFPCFDDSVYKTNQLFRMAGHHKYAKREKGSRKPKLMANKQGEYSPLGSATKVVNGLPISEYRKKYLINNVAPNSRPLPHHDASPPTPPLPNPQTPR